MKKTLLIGGGGIVVIIIVAVVGVFLFSGDIIKAAVEDMGPKLTKSEVKLAKVDLSLTSGQASLSGLKIGNPSGFKTSHAFKLDNISLKLDTGSLGSDTIVINEILINAPDIIAEFNKFSFNPLKAGASVEESLKTSNFIAIQNNVDAFVKANTGGGSSSGSTAKSGDGGAEKKLIVEKFRMTGVKVRAVAHEGLKLDTSLPPFSISLDNIGKKEKGLSPDELAAVLISKVRAQVTDAMTKDLIKSATEMFGKLSGSLKDAAGGAMKSVTEGAGGALKSVTDGAGGAGAGVGDAATKATEGIKNLFGK